MSITTMRPNGKPYQRRKPITISEFTTRDGWTGVCVQGTHDLAHAAALAGELLSVHELLSVAPCFAWWRLVPWDTSGQCDSSWIDDPTRGTPCVVWEPS